jgi:predicted dehydrogenase
MTAVCGRDEAAVGTAAARLGWERTYTDWRDLVAADDIDVVDICTPGDSHGEIALAALAAGKHVLCEKPLANTVAEAATMAAAAGTARAAGIRSMCGFTYRRVPAVTYLQQLIAAGRLGTVRHVRAVYLQDWIVDPQFPLVWRLQKERAGSGALGDIGAHIVDLTQFVTGQSILGVSAITETFVTQRPLPAASSGLSATSSDRTGPVTVDDAALFLARLSGGAVASYEASRFATGRKNGLRVEINGSLGSAVFDLERLNELEFYDGTRPGAEQGFSRILVTEPDHPYLSAWWPPGHLIGYEHAFTHQMRDFVEAVAVGKDPEPSFADALQVQSVLDAVERSAAAGAGWTDVPADLATDLATD